MMPASMQPRFCERLVMVALFLSVVLASSRADAVDVCYQLPFSNPNLADGWGSLCCGRTTPHRGVDFAQPSGTKVPSVADGVVVKVTSTSCLGNVVVVKHPDGMYSGYAHLSAALVSQGQSVSKGQHIAATGNSGTCTTGPHLHLTMSPEETGYMLRNHGGSVRLHQSPRAVLHAETRDLQRPRRRLQRASG
jgi:murein DD-endopeptidase MepM/ murein hydrolase activator NlpD